MFDHVSDLHLDNAILSNKPQGWLARRSFDEWRASSNDILVVAGDTAEHIDDTIDVLNRLRDSYEHVVAVLGNHEQGPPTKALRDGVVILDHVAGHSVTVEDVTFIGACLDPADPVTFEAVLGGARAHWQDASGTKLVIVSHFAPVSDLTPITGKASPDKCNGLIERLGPPPKPTTIVFGHVHIEAEVEVDGYRIMSNPRGYRGLRRDRTSFEGFRAA